MAEDYKVHDGKKEGKVEETKIVETPAVKKPEVGRQVQNSEKSKNAKAIKKSEKRSMKTEAVVNGSDLSVGRKHAVAICNFIRGKDIDVAIKDLEDVVKMRKAVPMKGEIPHRHGMTMASGSGRYPVKAAGIYIALLKSLKANAIVNELELEKFRIYAMPNRAARPYKRFGQGRFKRTHVMLKLIPRVKNNKEKKK